jgi:hypothetical protein
LRYEISIVSEAFQPAATSTLVNISSLSSELLEQREYDGLCSPGCIILSSKQAAQSRANTQQWQCPIRDIENANVFWRSNTSHIKLIIVIGTYVRKGRILLAIDKVDRRSDPHFLEAHLLRRVINSKQAIRVVLRSVTDGPDPTYIVFGVRER